MCLRRLRALQKYCFNTHNKYPFTRLAGNARNAVRIMGNTTRPFYIHAVSGKAVTGLAALPVARNSVGYFIHYVSADVKHSSRASLAMNIHFSCSLACGLAGMLCSRLWVDLGLYSCLLLVPQSLHRGLKEGKECPQCHSHFQLHPKVSKPRALIKGLGSSPCPP